MTAAQAKLIKSLQLAKFRKQHGLFVVEGDKMVLELLQQSSLIIDQVYALRSWIDEQHSSILPKYREIVLEVSEHQLRAISGLTTPNKVIAVARIPTFELTTLPKNELSLYLDQIQDPGNVGTILRLADWYGIKWVVCSPATADIYSPKVIQASMGAYLHVQTVVSGLDALDLNHIPVLAADMQGKSIYSDSLPKNGVLILGNEGKGISVSLEPLISERITIPRHPKGGAESLNVAMATAIILSQLRKP